MKITCDSCQAKYTIADEKVVGKIVKIKCKKCGTTIVVNGNDAAANGGLANAGPHSNGGAIGAAEDEWTVNVSDDDQRTMSTQQLVDDYRRGVVTNDTYVWKDGMADWLPVSDVAELAGQLGGGASAPTPLGLGGTAVIGNTGGGGLSPFAAPRAAAASPFSAAAPAAARRAGGRAGGGDVFGAAAEQAAAPSSQSNPDRAVGERNENSVLFSLSALTATENAMKAQAGRSNNEDASIDLGPGPSRNGGGNARGGGFDDIMNLGGGMGGGLSNQMLAPPPIMAPVVEAPPPPSVSAMPSAMPGGMAAMQYAPPPPAKSKTGLIIGILLGIIVIGGGAFFLGSSQKGPEPTANNTTPETPVAAQPTPTEQQAAPTPTPADTAATPPPTDTSQASATPSHEAVAANPGGKPGSFPAGGKPKEEPKSEPKAEPKAEAKPAETSAPAAGGQKEFNRGAASAALGGAAGAARSCKKADGPTGSGKVKVTFAPSGNVTSASVVGAPFAGTSVGGCIASAFRSAKVPPFDGSPVSVTKSFSIN